MFPLFGMPQFIGKFLLTTFQTIHSLHLKVLGIERLLETLHAILIVHYIMIVGVRE